MNKKDYLILTCLRQNGRQLLTKISKKTGIPISTLHDRLKIHLDGSIGKICALLNYEKLGYTARANVLLKVNKQQKIEISSFLEQYPNVNCLFKINNGYDFLFECVFRNLNELEMFMDVLEEKFCILKRDVYYVMENVKQESFLSDSLHLSPQT